MQVAFAISCNISLNHYMNQMLSLRRTMEGSTSGEWSDEEFNVFNGDVVVGRILRSQSASSNRPWLWTITDSPYSDADNWGYSKNLETALAELTSQWETVSPAATSAYVP